MIVRIPNFWQCGFEMSSLYKGLRCLATSAKPKVPKVLITGLSSLVKLRLIAFVSVAYAIVLRFKSKIAVISWVKASKLCCIASFFEDSSVLNSMKSDILRIRQLNTTVRLVLILAIICWCYSCCGIFKNFREYELRGLPSCLSLWFILQHKDHPITIPC